MNSVGIKILSFFICLPLIVACVVEESESNSVDVWEIIDFSEYNYTMYIAPYHHQILIEPETDYVDDDGILYQWYESIDNTRENLIVLEGETKKQFVSQKYDKTGIYHYWRIETRGEQEEVNAVHISIAYTGLPAVYVQVSNDISDITKEDWQSAEISLYDTAIHGGGYNSIEIKGRGNTSWKHPKKGYNIKLENKESLLGLGKAKNWCIIANYSDKTLLRNRFAFYLGNEILNAEWNPSFRNVDVVLNGEYYGNYTFGEKITLTKSRIPLQDIFDVENYLLQGKTSDVLDSNGDGIKDLYDGAFILEVDSRLDADFYFISEKGLPFCLKQTPDELSIEIQNHVQNIVQNVESVLFGEEFISLWQNCIDIDSAVDWYLINEFCKNPDAKSWSSIYLYYNPKDGKLHLGPIWDFDLACANTCENDSQYAEGWWIKDNVWISRCFEDSDFVEKIKSRWNSKKHELNESVNFWLRDASTENKASADYNFMCWDILGKYVKPNVDGWEGRTTYESEVEFMIGWLNARYEWLDNAINGL